MTIGCLWFTTVLPTTLQRRGRNVHDRPHLGSIVIPYVRVSETQCHTYTKRGISVHFKLAYTLCSIKVSTKEKVPLGKYCGTAYQLQCQDCNSGYFGENSLCLGRSPGVGLRTWDTLFICDTPDEFLLTFWTRIRWTAKVRIVLGYTILVWCWFTRSLWAERFASSTDALTAWRFPCSPFASFFTVSIEASVCDKNIT